MVLKDLVVQGLGGFHGRRHDEYARFRLYEILNAKAVMRGKEQEGV